MNLYYVNYMTIIYMVMNVPMNFPSSSVLDSWGLRAGLTIGVALTTIGFWLKCLIKTDNFAYVLTG